MKAKLFLVLLVIVTILLGSCSENKTKIEIIGTVEGAAGKYVSLYRLTASEKQFIDSVKIDKSNRFVLHGNVENIGIYMLTLGGLTQEERESEALPYLHLIIRPKDKIEIISKLGSYGTGYVVYGSEDSKRVQKLVAKQHETMMKVTELSEVYYDAVQNRKEELDSVKLKLDKQYKKLKDAHRSFSNELIESDISSLANIMILYQRLGVKETVYNPIDDMELFINVDSALRAKYPESDVVQQLSKDVAQVKEYLASMDYRQQQFAIGKIPPEIALPNPEGDTILLSSTRGKIVLLDFWASWCAPCRKENPYLVKAYNKFNDKGFEIFQVSLDRTHDGWVNGIKKQNLSWVHVSDLKYYDSPVAKTYGIQRIPTNFLLNKKGEIIAKDLRGEELEKMLEEIL